VRRWGFVEGREVGWGSGGVRAKMSWVVVVGVLVVMVVVGMGVV
jgi:hypothetical protein